ncbi:dual-specificity MAP kinase phosphatase-) [Pyrenophora tritici-repentis Pt-1C-BFP]|uniref:Dual-specificity MAP kinase phosphatase- n=1 Tax=Pyrenophora tritici-repentis (strain Pt-1C-BFP) TaxID=426418 RepID=B2VRH8_PYRTR|nr:dual-specificity MAP kinase phosphatase-) [Pyrenophora tritici-repentis Pt-1C-BFP]EDU39650.1 dual-specificity MAP kinase phosphatase-) [Pyrenophora tritici-repentis Pt-1C-BFP]
MDSSSVTDPSPGVSPESPLAKTITPSSFVADFRSRRSEVPSGEPSPNNFFELQRPTTPAKKPRNLKNLGINTASSLGNLRAHNPAPPAVAPKEKNSSAPPSPLFIKPPTPPKRRPSNLSLTISTPGSTENKPLPPLRPVVPKQTGLSEVPFEMEEEEDQEPNFDIPQSREEKPAAYPNGPICIYEAGVYLYFEPTAVQATTFDVIINVASEVKNPFTNTTAESQKDIDARRIDGPPAENVDFTTLSQRPKQSFGMGDASPTTPKATAPVMQTIQPREVVIDGKTYKTPEYIHMPWEHNTDIVPDLHKLVKMIDERVQRGKRVLIHCQCGRASTGNIMAISPGPLSAPSGAFSTGFRRSWDSSPAHFELPSPSTPAAQNTTPYVDPKGHVVPVLSVTSNDLPTIQTEDASHDDDSPPQDGSEPSNLTPLMSPRVSEFFASNSNHAEPPEITSPITTSFPKDVFGSTGGTLDEDLKSPRATEFHMTPLKPRPAADEDPFGLTSPTRADFNPFDRPSITAIKHMEAEERRPSFQAILPPAHQTFNGFASLDGTAQTFPTFQAPISLSTSTPKHNLEAEARIDSLSSSPEKHTLAPIKAHTTMPGTFPKAPTTPKTPSQTFLSTPAKAIRTRFSSPNMREQRKLQKLQTEIQSRLPPVPQHAADDLDALMSPRAEEFTRNPFHFELRSPTDDASPVSSNETIKDGRNGHSVWEEPLPRQWTPEKATVDPRSPVQTGSSPIVRNIWDVL